MSFPKGKYNLWDIKKHKNNPTNPKALRSYWESVIYWLCEPLMWTLIELIYLMVLTQVVKHSMNIYSPLESVRCSDAEAAFDESICSLYSFTTTTSFRLRYSGTRARRRLSPRPARNGPIHSERRALTLTSRKWSNTANMSVSSYTRR